MIKLYTFPPSTNSRKVRIALIEKGLEFERVNVDLTKREQKNPDYLKLHPVRFQLWTTRGLSSTIRPSSTNT
jgi:glutathione S-transferase